MTHLCYTNGEYFSKHPDWHIEDSPWKAEQIALMLRRNNVTPSTICEVGCGAGEILRQLQQKLGGNCECWGYEISPQAFELCRTRASESLHYKLADIQEEDVFFDLILMIDLIEHMEDYFSLLRAIKHKSVYKVLHIPLDLSVQTLLRAEPIIRTRRAAGHIHYFTKEIALALLEDVGYETVDYFYTELPSKSIVRRLVKPVRRLGFRMNKDIAVRILGGYSLMILAK